MGKVMNRMTGRLFVAISLSVALGATLAGLWLGPTRTMATQDISILVTKTPAPYQVENPGDEVLGLRTQTSRTTWDERDVYTLDASTGPIHYDLGGIWTQFDTALEYDTFASAYRMDGAGYEITILQETFDAGQIIQFEKGGETVAFQPMALEWANDLSQLQPIETPAEITPSITNETRSVVGRYDTGIGKIAWENAYGTGIDFEWTTTPTRLKKLLTISGLSDLPPPQQYIIDGGNAALQLNLIFSPSDGLAILVNGAAWNESTEVQTLGYIEFQASGETLFGFAPLYFWGSDPDDPANTGQSVATLDRKGGNLYISVRVPYEWLQSATFPVFIDTDIDEQVGAGSDDANSRPTPWCSTSATPIYMGYFTDHLTQGFRFTGITIADGSDVSQASIEVQASATDSDSVNFTIAAEDTVDMATYNCTDREPDQLYDAGHTTATSNWTPGSGWTADVWYDTYDDDSVNLEAIIDELINDASGLSNDEISILVESTSGSATRPIYAYEDGSTEGCQLHITYSAGCTPDLTLTGGNWAIGTVATSTTYWANGSTPGWPLQAINCNWSILNNASGGSIDVNIESTDFTGGNGWNLAGTAGADTVVLTAFEENDGSGDGQVITNSETLFVNSLGNNSTVFVEMSFGSATSHSDGVLKTATVTFTAVCE